MRRSHGMPGPSLHVDHDLPDREHALRNQPECVAIRLAYNALTTQTQIDVCSPHLALCFE